MEAFVLRSFIKITLWIILLALICCVSCLLIQNIYTNVQTYKNTVNPAYSITIEIIIPLLITFLGTFLGFILAIIGELKIDKIKTNKETKEIINALVEEIFINQSKIYVNEELYPEFYRLYSFEGICNSGKLYMIIKKPWYSQLVGLYNEYREVNYYFLLAIKQLQLGNNDEKIIESQKVTIEKLKEKAETLLNEIKK